MHGGLIGGVKTLFRLQDLSIQVDRDDVAFAGKFQRGLGRAFRLDENPIGSRNARADMAESAFRHAAVAYDSTRQRHFLSQLFDSLFCVHSLSWCEVILD